MKQVCENCRFWEEWVNQNYQKRYPKKMGDCKKRAPVCIDNEDSIFPSIEFDQWCGDFESKNIEETANPEQTASEELRDTLLDSFHVLVRYWANLKDDSMTVFDCIDGAVFSVLNTLDGYGDTVPFDLVARTDKNSEVKDGTTISCMLHEHWYKKDKKIK